jgi:hypothetical protein
MNRLDRSSKAIFWRVIRMFSSFKCRPGDHVYDPDAALP